MKVGIDVLEINRVNLTNLEKIFTQNEIDYFSNFANKSEHIAGTFAAKEAVFKCLNLKYLKHSEIEILHNENNRPYVNFIGQTKDYFIKNFSGIDISITHTKTNVIAVAIAF